MSDRHSPEHMKHDDPHEKSLAHALRALATPAPHADLWPVLVARARRRRHRHVRRGAAIALPLTLAATLAAALLIPRGALPPDHTSVKQVATSATQASPGRAEVDEIGALRTRSQRMQGWVHNLSREGAPLDAHSLTEASELEDMIGLVDLQLAASHGDSHAQAPLWRQRVGLLEQLAAVHINDINFAEANTTRATPARLWIN